MYIDIYFKWKSDANDLRHWTLLGTSQPTMLKRVTLHILMKCSKSLRNVLSLNTEQNSKRNTLILTTSPYNMYINAQKIKF